MFVRSQSTWQRSFGFYYNMEMEYDAPIGPTQQPQARSALAEAAATMRAAAVGAGVASGASFVDLKGVAKPPQFSGSADHWSEFRYKLESVAGLLNLDGLMDAAVRADDMELAQARQDPDIRAKGALLYNMLVQVTHGRALAIVRLVEKPSGLLAWRSTNRQTAQPAW